MVHIGEEKISRKILIVLSSVLILCFSLGCTNLLKREYPQKKFYILEPDYSKLPQTGNVFPNLVLTRIKVSPYFEGKSFVYRQGEHSYESDYYNEFFVLPSNNLNEIIQKWIELTKKSNTTQDLCSLSINLESLYIDLRKKEDPKAVWTITFSIQNYQNAEVLYKKQFTEELSVTENTPEAIVNSWNLGLTNILIQLHKDLDGGAASAKQLQSIEKTSPSKKRK